MISIKIANVNQKSGLHWLFLVYEFYINGILGGTAYNYIGRRENIEKCPE